MRIQLSKIKLGVALCATILVANCSGKTYSTFFQPFDLIFGGKNDPNPSVNVGLAGITPLSPTRIRVEFSKYIDLATGENPENYTISDADGNDLDIVAVTRDPANPAVFFIDTSLHRPNTTYTLTARNLRGVDGSTLTNNQASGSYTSSSAADRSAPHMLAVNVTSSTGIAVTFNEAVVGTTPPSTFAAADFRYYSSLANCNADTSATNIVSGTRDALNFAKVQLTTAALGSGPYYLRAFNVRDLWGNTVSNSCVEFAGYSAPAAPKLLSAVAQSPTSILFTFDTAMTNDAALRTATNYTVGSCPVTLTASAVAYPPASGPASVTTVLVNFTKTGSGAGSCRAQVTSGALTSTSGNLVSPHNAAYFPYSDTATGTAPSVVSVAALNANTVRVLFNEPISNPSAANFTFAPSLTISSLDCSTTAPLGYCDIPTSDQTTQNYTLTISGITDSAGNAMAATSVGFTGDGKPYVVSVVAIDSETIRLIWSEPVTATGIDLGDFEINDAGPTSAGLFPAGAASSDTMELKSPVTLVSGTSYTFKYHDDSTQTRDLTNNPTLYPVPLEQTLSFNGPAYTPKPAIGSVVALGPFTLQIVFNHPLNNAELQLTDFTLGGTGCPGNGHRLSVLQSSAGVVLLTLQNPGLPGSASATNACSVSVSANQIYNLYGVGNDATSGNYTYPGTGADTTAPSLLSVTALSATEVQVVFSEPVTTASGQNSANYSFSPAVSVSAITCTGAVCTLTVSGQSAQSYTLTVSGIQDDAGNTLSSGSASFFGFDSDSTAPTLFMAELKSPTVLELIFSEAVSLTSAQTLTNYLLSLAPCDLVSNSSCVSAAVRQSDWSKVRLTLANGAFGSSNSFTVEGKTAIQDLVGNALTTPRSRNFNGYADAPTNGPGLAAASDTGSSNSDRITNPTYPSPGLQFTGTVTPNTTVVLYQNGVQVGAATSDSSGNYTITVTSSPGNGTFNYTVATVLANGSVSAPSPVVQMTSDTSAPSTPTAAPTLAAASDSGYSNSDRITNVTTNLVFTGWAGAVDAVPTNDANYPIVVKIYDGTTLLGQANANTDGSYSITVAGPLAAGSYSNIRITATDAAGNESPTSAAMPTLTIDTSHATITASSIASDNSYVQISFSEGVYGSASSATAVSAASFTISTTGGVATASINCVTDTASTSCPGTAPVAGATAVRVQLTISGIPNGSEQITIAAANNALFERAGNASPTTVSTGAINLNAAGIANITGGSYTAPALPAGTGSTSGYVTVNFSNPAYTNSGPTGGLTASDFVATLTNTGNATSVTIACVKVVAATDCTGANPSGGETSVRVFLTFDAAPSGTETVRISAATGEIWSTGGATPDTSNTGNLAVEDRLAPVISAVTPASSSSVNHTRVSYSLSEACAASANTRIRWTRTGGSADAGSPHTALLVGSELAAGTHTDITLTNAPTLVNGAIYTVAFDCVDAAGNAATTVSSTSVTYDVGAPTVTSVTSSSADGSYGVGSTITVQVVFSEVVTVTGGTPQLVLATGTPTTTTINYVAGSGSTTLSFTYTVAAGNSSADLDYANTSALSLGGATIRDAAGNNATLTLATPGAAGSLGDSKNIVIDTTAPTVTNVTSSTANGSYKAGDVISIQVTFSEVVVVTGTPQLTLETGTTDAVVNYASGSGTATLTFNYTVAAGHTSADLDYLSSTALALAGGSIRDNVGTNPNDAVLTLPNPGASGSLGANKDIIIDTTAPTVTNVTSTTANGTYGASAVIVIQVTFSEPVTVAGGTPTLALAVPTSYAVNYTTGSGTNTLTFEYTVQTGHTSSDLDYTSATALSLGTATIRDAAGNDAVLTLPNPGASGSLGANKDIVINATATFNITAAETLDCDPVDGIIDHYKITLGAAARDNTFDGYIANSEGLPTAKWAVAGRSNVRLHHGSSLPSTCGTDTANDTVIYIKFNQGSSSDTGQTPDITGTNDVLVADSDGVTKLFNTGNWTTTDVSESDKAGPFVYFALAAEAGAAETGVGPGDTLTLRFSERTNAPGSLTGVSLDTIFELNNSHTFGAAANVSSAVWSTTTFTNDTLTLTFANTNPTVAVGDTIKLRPQATLTDNVGNQAAATTAVTSPAVIGGTFNPGQIGPRVTAAAYLDTDSDGYIDTVRITFDMTVQDSSFPGYILNSLGNVTTTWQVAGYNNVRLIHGTAVTFATDTANDNTIYLRFAEGSTYDTGVKPDLTATDQSLYGPAGGTLGTTACYVNTGVPTSNCNTLSASDVLTTDVVETDQARPIIVKATAKVGANSVFVSFSENVASDAAFSACGSGGELIAADFTYVDGNAAAPNGFATFTSADTCATGDAFIEATANALFNTGDFNVDRIRAATATSIYDAAANGMLTTMERTIVEATAPYVLAASTYYNSSTAKYYARIFFSEPVSNAAPTVTHSALRTANYSVVEDPASACTDFSATPANVVAVGGSNRVFDLETGAQCTGTRYRVTASTSIKDIDEFENVGTPNFAFADGTGSTDTTAPRLLLARSLSATTVELTFSEPMKTGDISPGSTECKSTFATAAVCTADIDSGASGTQYKYWITPTLGNVTNVSATADTSVFIVTHAGTQSGNFYTINVYASNAVANIPQDLAGNRIATAPGNQTVFQGAGTPIVSFEDGAVFDDPFSDGTKFNFAFTYQNKVYLGPNDRNNAAFRFEADGLNPVGITFYTTGGGTCNPATSFGISGGSCGAQTIGPNGERGIVSFNSGTVTVSGTDYEILLLGPIKDGVTRTYFTQDVDTQLDWKICTFSVTGGGNTKSIQSSYAFKGNDKYYSGFSSDHNQQAPILAATPLTASGGVLSCGTGTDLTLRAVDWLGKNAGTANPAKAANSNAVVGIDSMLYVESSPSPAGEFYVANNGGIASATSPFTSFAPRVTQSDFASVSGAGAVTLVLPYAPAGLEKVRPGQKGMPVMTIWNGAIYAARNLAVAQTSVNQVVNNGGELWKCKTNCTTASNWKLVAKSANFTPNSANLKAISLLQVNGSRLYVGFDNPTDGAQIYRSNSGITEIDSGSGCGDATPDNGDGHTCFTLQGSPGFGNPTENQYFISSASLRKGSQNYIYVTVGDVNLVAIKVLRQID